MKAILPGRGYDVPQELPEEALYDVPESPWDKRSDEWQTNRLNNDTRLLCDQAATALRQGFAVNQWRVIASSNVPKLSVNLLSNGTPLVDATRETWGGLYCAARSEMAERRRLARQALTGKPASELPLWFTEGREWVFAEHPDTRDEQLEFEGMLELYKANKHPKAHAYLQDLLDGKRTVAVAMTVREKKDWQGKIEQKAGIARVEVDHRLRLVRLTDPNLAHPERMAQLVRAAQILIGEQRPEILAEAVKNAPRYSQILPGAVDLLSSLRKQEPVSWPDENERTPQLKKDRLKFLTEASFVLINEALNTGKQLRWEEERG